ncbi:lantibiotic dehydratase [Kitasatospora sp. NPDC098652]|uniref:lantibiotic dehydratase n=1 Tax=Kitasatospora sp. NPDC098652 TaxID=3364095 RepID=UPI003812BEF7
MRRSARSADYRAADVALVRAVARPGLPVPAWPDLTDASPELAAQQIEWLRVVWADEGTAEALALASPVLARQVERLVSDEQPQPREVRHAALSTARYLLRASRRPTPFGHFAGVQAATFGPAADLRWGDDHHTVARAQASWIAQLIGELEHMPAVLERLMVVANDTVVGRGDRLVVPHQPLERPRGGTGAVEVNLRLTPAVVLALAAARRPVPLSILALRLYDEYPSTPRARIDGLLAELVTHRALITSLHAPATEADPLGHLLAELEKSGADEVPEAATLLADLRAADHAIGAHAQAPSRAARAQITRAMAAARPGTSERPVPAVDVRLDADLVLPWAVADEAAKAAGLLARLSPLPYGSAAWRSYHQRFYERYGRGSLVLLRDMVSDAGIGWPDGYPGARPAEPARFGDRDEVLAALAQRAALDGQREVVLDDRLLDALDLGPAEGPRLPPHLEIVAALQAASRQALDRGEFWLEVVSVARAAGVSTGRFLHLLEPRHQALFTGVLTSLPTMDDRAVAAQLSCPPLDAATGHVARSTATGQLVVSLGEHHPSGKDVLRLEDLAVGCDGRRMYLADPEHGRRIEASATHALNLRSHTSPMARLITELSRAQSAQVTAFSWGALHALPFRPRLRHGRVILSPAAWRLSAAELPPARAPWEQWEKALLDLLGRLRAPRRLLLAADSQGLPLDLDQTGHRVLLRSHLARAPHAVLVETPAPADLGWAGGRAHEIAVPVTATRPPAWPRLPKPAPARVLRHPHGDAPGASRVLLASLYGDIDRQDTVLTRHLPDLLERLGQPAWWFARFRDPRQHLRLRIALPRPEGFGPAAAVISTWTSELHRAGLLSEVVYPTSYPEYGRWGTGQAWAAAERVFRTDSAAVLAHLSQPDRPERLALLTAHAVAIASGFTGSPSAGLHWLIRNVPATPPAAIARPLFREAVRLADPADDFAALRGQPGGGAIVDAWADRHQALDAYRAFFPHLFTPGIAPDDVLGSLLHCSYARAHRIDFDDEAQVLYLARAAALARLSRDGDL